MELKYKYYHGVRSHNYNGVGTLLERNNKTLNDILYKYDCILKSGYILPYKDIKNLYDDVTRHPVGRCNGEDRVCISLHGSNPEQFDREHVDKYRFFEENAYSTFVNGSLHSTAIVLNEAIKDCYELIPQGMYLERQVTEPISLEYMDAISILPNERLIPYFEDEDYLKTHGCLLNDDFNLEFLYRLKSLLEKYGYNVPIISIVTGHEFSESKKEFKKTM